MPKHACPAFIETSNLALNYEDVTIFNVNFVPTAAETYSTY
jgi:hypothetical protein